MNKPLITNEQRATVKRIHPEQYKAVNRAKWLYDKRLRRCESELGDTKDRLLAAHEDRARLETALASAAHALETGTPPSDVLASIRIALRITPGGQPL